MNYVSCELTVGGGIGNRLFQIAMAIEYGQKHNKIPVFRNYDVDYYMDLKTKWKEIFGSLNIDVGKEMFDNHILVPELVPNTYIEIPYFEGNILFRGYWQAYGYMSSLYTYQKMVELVTHSKEYLERAIGIYNTIKESAGSMDDNDYVSMHSRVGDYWKNPMFHNLDVEYYRKAYDAIGGDKHVVVFSNELWWAKEHLKYPKITFVEPDDSYTELLVMSLFKYNIIANSTFSWWASYLNIGKYTDKKVVAPKKWFGEGTEYVKSWDGVYIPGWMVI